MNATLRRGLQLNIRLHKQTLSSVPLRATAALFANDKSNTNQLNMRLMSSLPYHLVVGMPALSPTMEAGTISSWKVGEGEAFAAGDSIAEIETDKATIDFEAQDDGVIAKILVEAGSGEINVGVPIVVTVEEIADVAAFKDFQPEPEVKAEEPAQVVEEAPVAVAVAPTPVTVSAAPVPVPVLEAAPEPVAAAAVEEVPADSGVSVVSPGWGNFAKVKSPLASTLSASQQKYIELYGSTGQVPL
jgi:pyruvate dehydrogenase E2 component (dihydrolipoamide acetyltransferase)